MAFRGIPKTMILADYIASHLSTPFKWGAHDCVLFAANWAGVDCVKDFGTWSTAREAAHAIKDAGGLEAAIDARFERVNANFACDGDIALQNGTVMIFSGAHIVGPGENGLIFLSRSKAEIAWSIKCPRQ